VAVVASRPLLLCPLHGVLSRDISAIVRSGARGRGWLWSAAAYLGLIGVITYPQIRQLAHGIPPEADAAFNIWRLAWVAHQLPRHPWHLFAANIFYPEQNTLAYSDALLGPGILTAPFFWAGVNPVLIYNVALFAGLVVSGVAAYLLVEDLTGNRTAAFVSGALFTASPYRFGHYDHLELQLTMFLPLALLALHRLIRTRRASYALLVGVSVAMQTYCSIYYGVYLATLCCLVGPLALLAERARQRWRTLGLLAGSALVGALLVLPYMIPYVGARRTVGPRLDSEVAYYSATPADYLSPAPASVLYAERLRAAKEDLHLFPGFAVLLLAALALWPPLSRTAIVYAIAVLFAFEASLGVNGFVFPWLRRWVIPYQGLRAPGRFDILVVLALVVLAGLGVARVTGRMNNALRALFMTGVMAVVAAEARIDLALISPPTTASRVDRWLRKQPRSPIVELPLPSPDQPFDDIEGRHIYDSLFHWQPLLNGVSGFFPPSYLELLQHMRTFPDAQSTAYLKSRNVQYVIARKRLFEPAEYLRLRDALNRQSVLRLVAGFPETNGESLVYEVPR
jgi:hypothetical protein